MKDELEKTCLLCVECFELFWVLKERRTELKSCPFCQAEMIKEVI